MRPVIVMTQTNEFKKDGINGLFFRLKTQSDIFNHFYRK